MFFYITKRSGQRLRVTLSVEDADLSRLQWHMAGGRGTVGKYVARRANDGQTIYLHREVALRMGLVGALTGEGRSGESVDHINGNKLDCRRENLRLRNRKQQMSNTNDGLRKAMGMDESAAPSVAHKEISNGSSSESY